MKMPKWMVSGDEAEMRKACQDPQVLEKMMSVLERDMRAFWIVEWNLKVIVFAKAACAWYREQPNAASPKTMLSLAVRPGDDADEKLTHRLMSLARSYRCVDPLPTMLFTFFRVTSFMALEALKELRNFPELDEARLLLEEIFGLLETAVKRKLSLEVLKELLTKKIEAYVDELRKIAVKFGDWERELLGAEETDIGRIRNDAKHDEILSEVKRIARRTKTPPASARTQAWVLKTWNYYCKHPEALGLKVARHRVYVTDVWEVVKGVAMSEYNIKSMEEFAKIKHTAQTSERRR